MKFYILFFVFILVLNDLSAKDILLKDKNNNYFLSLNNGHSFEIKKSLEKEAIKNPIIIDISNLKTISFDNGFTWIRIHNNTILSSRQNNLFKNKYIDISPNPVISNLRVNSEDNIQKICVISLYGEILNIITPCNKEQLINLSEFPNNIYFLLIIFNDNVSIIKKIVKQS